MRYKNYNKILNWQEISELVKKENIALSVPNGLIVIKQNEDLFSDIHFFIQVLKKLKVNHWFKFYYDGEYDYLNTSINVNTYINESQLDNDVSLFSYEGEKIDGFNFIKKEFLSPKDTNDLLDKISKEVNTISSSSDSFRVNKLSDIGKMAQNFLSYHTFGRYHLDPAAAPFTGVAYEYKTPSYNQFNYGYGRSFNFLTAKHIASLEAVERFASEFYSYSFDKNTKFLSYNEISNKFATLPLDEIALEEGSQLTNDSKLYWTLAQDIRNGSEIYVPEDLVYYGNNPSREGYIRQMNDSSNGVALGSTYTEAMICALLELIERHSFLMTWYGNVPGRRIENYKNYLSDKEKSVIKRVEVKGARINLFEISVFEDVYVVWGLITNNKEGASISTYTSAGAGFSVDEAVRAALMEVSVGYLVQENYHEEVPEIPENITTIDDHIDYYANPSNTFEFDFVKKFEKFTDRGNSLLSKCHSQEEILNHLLSVTLKDYKRIIFANLTSKEMADNKLFVVKAIIPEFLPMTFGSVNLRISLPNINKSRKLLNLGSIYQVNRRPHPFP